MTFEHAPCQPDLTQVVIASDPVEFRRVQEDIEQRLRQHDFSDRDVFSVRLALEEAIVNAMVGAQTMTGFQGHQVIALPHDRLREVLAKYNRLQH